MKIWKQQKSLSVTSEEVANIQAINGYLVDNDESDQRPSMRLAIRVKDPIALAKRESMSAQVIGGVFPELITQKVYEQLRDEIAQGLVDKNVDADINIEIY